MIDGLRLFVGLLFGLDVILWFYCLNVNFIVWLLMLFDFVVLLIVYVLVAVGGCVNGVVIILFSFCLVYVIGLRILFVLFALLRCCCGFCGFRDLIVLGVYCYFC